MTATPTCRHDFDPVTARCRRCDIPKASYELQLGPFRFNVPARPGPVMVAVMTIYDRHQKGERVTVNHSTAGDYEEFTFTIPKEKNSAKT